MSRVLAIDPGYDRVGFAILEEKTKNNQIILHSECFTVPKNKEEVLLSVSERILLVCERMEQLIDKFSPEIIGIEKIIFGKNKKTGLSLAEVRGALILSAGRAGIEVLEFYPNEIKKSVTGYGSADKKQVAKMITMMFSIDPKGRLDDEFDAIAVGVTTFLNKNSKIK